MQRNDQQITDTTLALNLDQVKDMFSADLYRFTKMYELIRAGYFSACNALYFKESGKAKTQINELFELSKYLIINIQAMEFHYQLDKYFINEFILLKLKSMSVYARARNLSASNLEDHTKSILMHANIIRELAKDLPHLEYANDNLFQEEMSRCIQDVCQSIEKGYIKYPKDFDFSKVVYDFSRKCADNFIKINYQYETTRNHVLSNKLKQGQISRGYIDIYDNAAAAYEKLIQNNQLYLNLRLDYINATFVTFKFLEETKPTLKAININKALQNNDNTSLKNYFTIYHEIKEVYIQKIIHLISTMDFSDVTVTNIAEIRAVGSKLVDFFSEHKELLLKWNKMLNGKDKEELQFSRDTIIKFYKYTQKLYSFYNKFFEVFPEGDYCSSTEFSMLLNPEDDFQTSIQSISAVNQMIDDFNNEEVVRDGVFQEEMQKKIHDANESYEFLCKLQDKEDEFKQKKMAERLARKKILKPVHNDTSEKNETDEHPDKCKVIVVVKSEASIRLDQAQELVLRNKHHHAIQSFGEAYHLAKESRDCYSELLALDGLSLTHGKVILKEFDCIYSILYVRSIISTHLPRSQRIALEVAVKNIIYKLNDIYNLSSYFLDLSQSDDLNLDEADSLGIDFSKDLIVELMQFAKTKIITIQIMYKNVLTHADIEREKFIYKLGKAVARSQKKFGLNHDQIMELGWKKFEDIGKQKNLNNQYYGDKTREKLLFDELDHHFKQLTHSADKIISAIKGKGNTYVKDALLHSHELSLPSKMMSGTTTVTLPQAIQNLFAKLDKFSKMHYLYGDAIFDLIFNLNKSTVVSQNYQFITSSNDKKSICNAGFKQTGNNLYTQVTNTEKVELLSKQDNLMVYMSKQIFTINSLFCNYKDGKAVVYDVTGKGLRDLDQMRLVMTVDPNEEFVINPISILSCVMYQFKGFHLELNIRHALDTLKHPGYFEGIKEFENTVKAQLSEMDYASRMKYVKIFIQYNLTDKLFNIKFDGNPNAFLLELEKKLKLPSVCLNNTSSKLFVAKPQIASNDSLMIRNQNGSRNYKKNQ